MINLREKQVLCSMATDSKKYGTKIPHQIKGRWTCPHCDFEHGDLDNLAAHLVMKCCEISSSNI